MIFQLLSQFVTLGRCESHNSLSTLHATRNASVSKMARRSRSHLVLPQMFGSGQDDFPAAEPVCDFDPSPVTRSAFHATRNASVSKMVRRLRSHPVLLEIGRGQNDFPTAEPVCGCSKTILQIAGFQSQSEIHDSFCQA